MDAAQALSELTALSAQITAAIVIDADGAPLASTLEDARAKEITRTVQELVAAASRAGDDGKALAQLEVSTPDGGVFVVRDGERVIAATTQPDPVAGLVFYDLKTSLRSIGGTPKPTPRAKPKQAKNGDA